MEFYNKKEYIKLNLQIKFGSPSLSFKKSRLLPKKFLNSLVLPRTLKPVVIYTL